MTTKQDATVFSVPAVAVARYLHASAEVRAIADEEAAYQALMDPENYHVCPLCHDTFMTAEFKRHAPSCIRERAPILERQRDRPLGRRDDAPAYPRLISLPDYRKQGGK